MCVSEPRAIFQAVDAVCQVLLDDPRVEFALLFGSAARGTAHAGSDVDVAVGLKPATKLTALELGDLISRLERAAGHAVDLLVLNDAPSPIAYRVFRDGRLMVEKNHQALVDCKAGAILEYLDFRPVEALAVRGVLRVAAHGR